MVHDPHRAADQSPIQTGGNGAYVRCPRLDRRRAIRSHSSPDQQRHGQLASRRQHAQVADQGRQRPLGVRAKEQPDVVGRDQAVVLNRQVHLRFVALDRAQVNHVGAHGDHRRGHEGFKGRFQRDPRAVFDLDFLHHPAVRHELRAEENGFLTQHPGLNCDDSRGGVVFGRGGFEVVRAFEQVGEGHAAVGVGDPPRHFRAVERIAKRDRGVGQVGARLAVVGALVHRGDRQVTPGVGHHFEVERHDHKLPLDGQAQVAVIFADRHVGGRQQLQDEPVGFTRSQRRQLARRGRLDPRHRWQREEDRGTGQGAGVHDLQFDKALLAAHQPEAHGRRLHDQPGMPRLDQQLDRHFQARPLVRGEPNAELDQRARVFQRRDLVMHDGARVPGQLGRPRHRGRHIGRGGRADGQAVERQAGQVLQLERPAHTPQAAELMANGRDAGPHPQQREAVLHGRGPGAGMIRAHFIEARLARQRYPRGGVIARGVGQRRDQPPRTVVQDVQCDRLGGDPVAQLIGRPPVKRDRRASRRGGQAALHADPIGRVRVNRLRADGHVVVLRHLGHGVFRVGLHDDPVIARGLRQAHGQRLFKELSRGQRAGEPVLTRQRVAAQNRVGGDKYAGQEARRRGGKTLVSYAVRHIHVALCFPRFRQRQTGDKQVRPIGVRHGNGVLAVGITGRRGGNDDLLTAVGHPVGNGGQGHRDRGLPQRDDRAGGHGGFAGIAGKQLHRQGVGRRGVAGHRHGRGRVQPFLQQFLRHHHPQRRSLVVGYGERNRREGSNGHGGFGGQHVAAQSDGPRAVEHGVVHRRHGERGGSGVRGQCHPGRHPRGGGITAGQFHDHRTRSHWIARERGERGLRAGIFADDWFGQGERYEGHVVVLHQDRRLRPDKPRRRGMHIIGRLRLDQRVVQSQNVELRNRLAGGHHHCGGRQELVRRGAFQADHHRVACDRLAHDAGAEGPPLAHHVRGEHQMQLRQIGVQHHNLDQRGCIVGGRRRQPDRLRAIHHPVGQRRHVEMHRRLAGGNRDLARCEQLRRSAVAQHRGQRPGARAVARERGRHRLRRALQHLVRRQLQRERKRHARAVGGPR
ncbi:MAG: hypothetical protein BWX84_01929 [Verrucomicrobia bacterium ADurb.Bin118]|nr:MAG: hypothetical protein BWX84_01929 [Verrucomicrobia bacterium ADurb.Bin118]